MKKLDNVFLEAKRNYEYVVIDKKNGSHIFLVPCKLCQKPKKVRLSWIRTNQVPICKNCSVENRRVKTIEENRFFWYPNRLLPYLWCLS